MKDVNRDSAYVQTITHNAKDWAVSHLGSRDYPYRCLGFVEDAYERANSIELFGGDTAKESADFYGVTKEGTPPFGSFVFYDSSGTFRNEHKNWGHVGLAIGDNKVIHSWGKVRIDDYLAVEKLSAPKGWTKATYIGYVPPAVLLKNHKPRNWEEKKAQQQN